MATKRIVTLEDDLDGGPADETLRFTFGGADYEIDLNANNAGKFRRQLAPFASHARKAGRAQGARAARTSSARQRGGDIRVWARGQGIEISDRGRIPADVVERYEATTSAR